MRKTDVCKIIIFLVSFLISVTGLGQTNLAGWVMPQGKDKPWQMKYQMYDNNVPEPANDLNGNNWKDLSFDDSLWETLTGPMGRSDGNTQLENYVPTHYFSWEGDNHIFYLRRTFNLTSIPSEGMTFHSIHDDALQVYINGVLVKDASRLEDSWQSNPINDPLNVFVKGKNIIAIKYWADTYRDYLDYGLFCEAWAIEPQLTLTTSKSILAEGETFELTVTASHASETTTSLMLTCDNSARFDFPSKLTLPAGETTVSTTVTVINDNDIAEIQSAAFTVSARDYKSDEALVIVNDDDMPHIEMILAPTTVLANAGSNAIMGTIRRSDHLNSKLTVVLSDNSEGVLSYSSHQVTLERGESEAHFTISTNGSIDTDREVNVTAAVYVKTCNCTAEAQSGGSTSQTLTLLAGEGAALTIKPLTTDFVLDTDNNGLVITIESPVQHDLMVTVSSDFDDKLDHAPTVVVPAGETSVIVPIGKKSEAVLSEGQVITFTATADGYATAACWTIATGGSLPDAIIESFEVSASEAEAESEVELTIIVKNDGSGELGEDTSVKIQLSDGSYPVMLKTGTVLSSGESTTITSTYQLPLLIGDYSFMATVNPTGRIEEAITTNNMSQKIPITIKPCYQVTAQTDKATYGQGEVITVTGTATGSKNAFVDVEVYFINDDMRQTVTTKTNAEGRYSVVFLPIDETSGHFVIGTCFPGEDKTDAMAEVDVYGLKLQSHRTTCQLEQGGTYNGSITVSNPGDKPQTGLQVIQQDISEGCAFSFSRITKIEAGETLEIPYTINATGNKTTEGVERMYVSIQSNEGAMVEHAIDCSIAPARGCLKTDSASITMNITQGVAREFPLTVWNEGLASTGTISITLPNWIQSVTAQQLPSLVPGDSVTIILRIVPTDNMYPGIPKKGHIGMNCAEGKGLSIRIEVTPVLEDNGTVTIDVLDEFTYCTEEKPHVSGAKVQIINIATQTVVAEGITNAEGKLSANILAGWYRLKVTADYHEEYDEYLLVDPGTDKTKLVFISFNGITTEWKVEETEIEDEYSMETVVKFETQVPPPYIDVIWPDEKPQQGKYFPVTLVNKGLIDFFDVKTTLSVTSNRYEVEIMGNPDIDTLKAGQSVVLHAKLTPKNSPSLTRRTSDSGGSDCWELNSNTEAKCECYTILDKIFSYTKNYGKCGRSSSSSGTESEGHGDDDDNTYPTEKKEDIACDLPKFKLVTVDGKTDVLGVACDGISKAKIVLDGNYEGNITNVTWKMNEVPEGYGTLSNYNILEPIFTAPSKYPPSTNATNIFSHKISFTATCSIEGYTEPQVIDNAITIELIRVPVVMVHGLNSSSACWSSMINYLKREYQDFQLYALNYSQTATNKFSENKDVVKEGFEHYLNRADKNHYVVSKIDIVAHSMGGLLTKLFLQNNTSYKKKVNKFITINTPHGGSQLGNFMTDPKINFINDIGSSWELVWLWPLHNLPNIPLEGPHCGFRSILNKLFINFYPRRDGIIIKNMLDGAVNDLCVGGTPINNLNNNKTTGINCHAIVTSGVGSLWYVLWESGQLKLAYNDFYKELGYVKVENLIQDIFDSESDMVVPEASQKGGLEGDFISYLPTTRPGNNSFTHTETCSNKEVQREVLVLLKSDNEKKFSNGFANTQGDIKYEMKGIDPEEKDHAMSWKHILEEFPYSEINKDNAEILYEQYKVYDTDAFEEWKNKGQGHTRKITHRSSTTESSFNIIHNYTEGDSIINISIIPNGNFSNFSFTCYLHNVPFSFERSMEGSVRLPDKVQDDIIVLCEGRREDGIWCMKMDTITINTIGNTTMQKLSFSQDSLLIINGEYLSPRVLCTWSDGVVTEVENPTLSVTNGNLAYIENNMYVYGKHTGHTNLVATFGGLTCSTPLDVYITDEAQDLRDEDDADTRDKVCSSLKMSIDHKSVMTRQAFRGTLTINNNHPSLSLQNLRLRLEARDEDGTLATQHEFLITPEALHGDFTGELDFDSGWNLKSGGTGVATILFIPTKNAAPTEPKRWSFGGTISYTDPFTGLVVTHSLKPITLTVNPTPVLDFTYFLQRDAFGDDPMTTNVSEASFPFEFALLINNKGNADAKNLRFVCKSPKIEENDQGLTASIRLLSSQLNGEDKALTMSDNIPIEVGTVDALSQTYVQWWMKSSLLGHFTEYDVSFDHKTSYGNEELSLIDQVSIHELIHGFTPHLSTLNSQFSTPQRAFLVNDIPDNNDEPDRIYFTDATQQEATLASEAVFCRQTSVNYTFSIIPSQSGWTYAVIDSPLGTNYQVARIIRQSDGVEIPSDNIWITDRTLRDGKIARIENKLHFIGEVPEGGEQFQIVFEYKPDLLLKVKTYEGVPTDGMELESPLTELTIHFNKAVNEETFTLDDLTLYHEGTKVDLSAATITKVDNQAFELNLGTATSKNGYYALMVNTQTIADSEGFEGVQSQEASWTQKEKEPEQIEVTDIAQLTDAIYITPFTAHNGGTVEIEINLKNTQAATAYIFDLELPEGITVSTNSSGKYVDVQSNRHVDHSPKINYRGNNTYSLSTLSLNSENLTGNDGTIRKLTLQIDDNMQEGTYAVSIKKASYAKLNGALVKLQNTTSSVKVEDYIMGDVNGNGQVDIGDAVSVVNYLVGKVSHNFVEKAADTNKNGQVDIGDAVSIINFLVGKTISFSREEKTMWNEREPQ